ncbi:MAG: hypothetical protein KBE41_01775 [Lutibacter sp.]|nr:hypothetical protein [Lutibacter sp.]MBP9600206.1 hypothetical protein [Lutibacter sp.]
MKTRFIIIFFISLVTFSFQEIAAQNIPAQIKKIDNEISIPSSTGQLKVDFSKAKITPPSNLPLNTENKLDINAVNKNLNSNQPKSNPNFLMETLPEDNDIIGKNIWQNKDVTHKKLASNFSLGTLKSATKVVKVECRDYSYVDGDRIRIYVNEKVVSDNIGLKGNYYVYYVNLEKGYNRIDFQAINQGFSGPNTAELNVYDANGNLISSKEWALETEQTATLGVLYQE